jgi:hypothetical protein
MTDATNQGPELQPDTLELINSELADRLERQAQTSSQIDTKAALLVGYAAAAGTILATHHSQPVLTWLALAALAAAATFGVWAYAVGTYQDVPDPRHLFNVYARGPKSDALAALAARRVRAFESNESRHQRKAARWRISLVALLIGVALMFAALYVHTGSHGRSVKPGHHPATDRGTAATGIGATATLAAQRAGPRLG